MPRNTSHVLNRVPAYRLHKVSGNAVVTLDGRDIYLGPHGSALSRAEYNRVIAEWMANGRQLPKPSESTTIVAIIARYWPHVKQYYRKNGQETSEVNSVRNALRPLEEIYGHTQAADFGPLALKALREAMIRRGWSRKYVNDQIGRVKMSSGGRARTSLSLPASIMACSRFVACARGGATRARPIPSVQSPITWWMASNCTFRARFGL
jgi:hypothetical protein